MWGKQYKRQVRARDTARSAQRAAHDVGARSPRQEQDHERSVWQVPRI